ncbi:MAG: DevR family CRISPR-associated autoregulator [Bacillota bacterium]|nr:DevR family CRISPR-associated autoregulator [Bacillota bacterium]
MMAVREEKSLSWSEKLKESAPTGVGIAARLAMDAHALNNEGTRNNAIIPRQVDVVRGDEIIQTNAISGDMVKHVYVDYLRRLSAAEGGVPLCSGCAAASPNRINQDREFQRLLRGRNHVEDAEVLKAAIAKCVIDDVAGLLVTIGRSVPRRSAIRFGWLLGIPDLVRTGRYTHVKLVSGGEEAGDEGRPADEGEGGNLRDGANLGQNIFTRPASSGYYGVVAELDLRRIGWNDISREVVVEGEKRAKRRKLAVEALYWTLANPRGAQENTQLPHVLEISGAVSVSFGELPPVLASPLAEGYEERMREIADAFGHLDRDVFVIPFGSSGELGEILAKIAGRVTGD